MKLRGKKYEETIISTDFDMTIFTMRALKLVENMPRRCAIIDNDAVEV